MIMMKKAACTAALIYFTVALPVLALAEEPKTSAPSEQAQVESPNIRSTRFDDWFHRCADIKAPNGAVFSNCEVAQVSQIKQGEESVNVLTLAIAKTTPETGKKASNNLLLTALVPLNVVLPIGLGLATEGKNVVTIPYRNCNQSGCWAQLKLDKKTLAALQKAESGEAHLRLMNGQDINLKFSLKGLSKALSELQKPSKV